MDLDDPAIRNANRGDSRELIRANRFADKIGGPQMGGQIRRG